MFQVYDSNSKNVVEVNSDILNALIKKWDHLHEKGGVFRYQIGILHERLIDKYLLMLNPNRGKKRRIPENFTIIHQPFDHDKFNFTKVTSDEVLFTLTIDNESDKHAIIINVSPLNRYHSLLCPFIDCCLPQVVTQESLHVALEVMLFIEDRTLKIAFNSLCAFASVNHLHYHIFFEHRTLAVETARWKHLKDCLYCLEDYVMPAFCFEVTQDLVETSAKIFKLLQYLLSREIPHNIFGSWGKGLGDPTKNAIRVYIWPRKSCSGIEKLAAFSVAACELAGWFTLYDIQEFDNMTRSGLEDELKKWRYSEFTELCEEVKSLY